MGGSDPGLAALVLRPLAGFEVDRQTGAEDAVITQLEFSPEHKDLIRRTIGEEKKLSDLELELFIYHAQRLGLDPLIGQIGVVRRKGKMVVQVHVDGHRAIADRGGRYAGSDDPVFMDGDKNPEMASVTVYKMVDGERCPFSATTRWSEYCPKGDEGFMWRKMPHAMLGKCAEVLALRKAFPSHSIPPLPPFAVEYVDSDGVVSDQLTRDTCITWGKKAGTAIKDLPDIHLTWAAGPDRNFGPDTDKWQTVIREEVKHRLTDEGMASEPEDEAE